MTQYQLRLNIGYEFDRPVSAGRQLFRILPQVSFAPQSLTDWKLTVSPTPKEQTRFTDFFGTDVIELVMAAGATHLDLTLEATLERHAPALALTPTTPAPQPQGIRALCAAYRGMDAKSPHHFLRPSPLVPHIPEVAEFAKLAMTGHPSALSALEAFGRALYRYMTFDAKATLVDTPPEVAFRNKRGVCQDFAQIMISGLRSLGIPAAYVAGYLRTLPPPGKPRLVGADAMHAWIRAWLGPELGWVDYDPTNATFISTDHIEVGMGRDYADVAPVTGFLRLEGAQTGQHSVDIEAILPPSETEVAA